MEASINKQYIQNASASFLDNVNELENEIKKLKNVLETINSAWEGADALRYINAMRDNVVPQLEQLKENLNDYGNFLSDVSGAYELLDELYSSKKLGV